VAKYQCLLIERINTHNSGVGIGIVYFLFFKEMLILVMLDQQATQREFASSIL
jgi:hypothetical protein